MVILFAFFPLFFIFVALMKKSFEPVFHRMKCKLYMSFIMFMLILAFRLVVYIMIQFSNVAFLVETYRGEIPLYISELIISICYMKIMVSLFNK